MSEGTCKIAFSREHWSSPFSYQIAKTTTKEEICSYKLTLQEKIIALALTILASPLLIGAVFIFYLTTAYFKNKTLKKISNNAPLNHPLQGLSLIGICPISKKEVQIHKGFGEFNLVQEWARSTCLCCDKTVEKIKSTIVEHCIYSYEAKSNEKDKKLMQVKDQTAIQSVSLDFPGTFSYIQAKVQPLETGAA